MRSCYSSPRFLTSLARAFILPCLWLANVASPRAGEPINREPVSFELTDQFNQGMTLTPPFSKPVIVTVADRKGAEQLHDWIAPLKEEFGDTIQFFAVADLRPVPGVMKGMIRRAFRKQFDYGVAMDWNGAAAGQVTLAADEANLLVLDSEGRVTFSIHGEATKNNLARLMDATRTAFKNNNSASTTEEADSADAPPALQPAPDRRQNH